MPHELPDGFHPWPGTREPRDDGPFQIILRGPWTKRVRSEWVCTRDQVKWLWTDDDKSGGDIIAVRKL